MSAAGERAAARARALIGTRFRPQGRGGAAGLDCVGLAAAALGVTGVRADYRLRGERLAALEDALEDAGLERIAAPAPGDVLVLSAGPQQLHLAVLTDQGFVHAHAGLGRVVETPGAPPWPVIGAWRGRDGERKGR